MAISIFGIFCSRAPFQVCGAVVCLDSVQVTEFVRWSRARWQIMFSDQFMNGVRLSCVTNGQADTQLAVGIGILFHLPLSIAPPIMENRKNSTILGDFVLRVLRFHASP